MDTGVDLRLEPGPSAFLLDAAGEHRGAVLGDLRDVAKLAPSDVVAIRPRSASREGDDERGCEQLGAAKPFLAPARGPAQVVDDREVDVAEPDRLEALLSLEILHLHTQVREPAPQAPDHLREHNPYDTRERRDAEAAAGLRLQRT